MGPDRTRTLAVDTHAHLDFGDFDADREEVLQRARECGIGAIVNVGTDAKSSQASVALAEKHPEVWAAVGIHPHDAGEARLEEIEQIAELAAHSKVIAIGEIGLDFYRDLSPREKQRDVFARLLGLARQTGLPVIIHSRAAHEETLEMVRREAAEGSLRGVFHCFSGDQRVAEQVLDLGFYISFCGNLTFKNSRLVDVLRAVPDERLLLETDSPFLAPEPHRGKRNEPAYLHFTVRKIAEVKGLSPAEVLSRTTANAIALFGLPESLAAETLGTG
ncbi:MAG: TatD family hydrolase [candidate division KSB1 bacterium]|nr:TatD family hydrolase [candidate division KSB1 bacterium]